VTNIEINFHIVAGNDKKIKEIYINDKKVINMLLFVLLLKDCLTAK
jgi:hypothetical protein